MLSGKVVLPAERYDKQKPAWNTLNDVNGFWACFTWKTKWQKMAASCKRVDHGKRKRKLLYSMKKWNNGKKNGAAVLPLGCSQRS